jgi:hypothetical protein
MIISRGRQLGEAPLPEFLVVRNDLLPDPYLLVKEGLPVMAYFQDGRKERPEGENLSFTGLRGGRPRGKKPAQSFAFGRVQLPGIGLQQTLKGIDGLSSAVVLDLFEQTRDEVKGAGESGFFGQKSHLVIVPSQVEIDPRQDVFTAVGVAVNGLMKMPEDG